MMMTWSLDGRKHNSMWPDAWQVRFGVLNAGNFGVSQSRKRTFIWGVAPGSPLPDWPALLHVFRSPQLTINLPGGVQVGHSVGLWGTACLGLIDAEWHAVACIALAWKHGLTALPGCTTVCRPGPPDSTC